MLCLASIKIESKTNKESFEAFELLKEASFLGEEKGCLLMYDLVTSSTDFTEKETDLLVKQLIKYSGLKSHISMAHLGYLYRIGKFVEKNLFESYYYYEQAIEVEKWAIGGYIETTKEINLIEYSRNTFLTVSQYAESGSALAMYYCGVLLMDGIGTDVDLSKALEWLSKSDEYGIDLAHYKIIDVLDKMDTSDSQSKKIKLLEKYYAAGDLLSAKKLAASYMDGKGVPKDISKSIEIIRDISKKDTKYEIELFLFLLKNGTAQSIDEAIILGNRLYSNGSGLAAYHLSFIYSSGKYVPKDLLKAKELMEFAFKKEINWSNNALIDLLIELGDKTSLETAKKIAKEYADKGDESSKRRLLLLSDDNV